MDLLYSIKKVIPGTLLRRLRAFKGFMWKISHGDPSDVPLEDQFPWTSPNVWEEVVAHYRTIKNPVIFEYGAGASSIHHIRNLLAAGGGTYIAVENDGDWCRFVIDGILRDALKKGTAAEVKETACSPGKSVVGKETRVDLRGPGSSECVVILHLRPPLFRNDDPEGGEEEYRDYVRALDTPVDVVIIDGRARRACVRHVLGTAYLREKGLLALMEAGRGIEGWLGAPASRGNSDYQPEVQMMLANGGSLVDGIGLDRWPGMTRRRTIGANAFKYPIEACIMVRQNVPISSSVQAGRTS